VSDSVNVTGAVSNGATSTILSAKLAAPEPWSSEFPNLYTLTVQLLATNWPGDVSHFFLRLRIKPKP
jgi:beta-galactosidase/beta-glucuronidase